MLGTLRWKGVHDAEQLAAKLDFNSVEEMHKQLKDWDLPDWLVGEVAANTSRSEARKNNDRERKARSTGPVTELPPASNAMPLFAENLEALAYANEDLVHRKENLRGGLFIQSAMYTGLVAGFLDKNLKTWSLGGGTWIPLAPLPELIAVYVLMGGEIEPLLEALYPGTATPEVREQIRKDVEGKKNKDSPHDGLKVVARRLARRVRGGYVRSSGTHSADITRHEYNVACRITELREEGWSDEDILQKLCQSKGFARVLSSSQVRSPEEEFQRLADLQLRFQDLFH
jgi:hypothetical protein